MKECKNCHEFLDPAKYSKDRKRPDGLQAYCKRCCAEKQRALYLRNPSPYKERAHVRRDKVREYLGELANKIKEEHGCLFCKERIACILDFHHINKGQPVTRMASKGFAPFQRELDKCIVVCANCHRKIHGGLLEATPDMLGKIKLDREAFARSCSTLATC